MGQLLAWRRRPRRLQCPPPERELLDPVRELWISAAALILILAATLMAGGDLLGLARIALERHQSLGRVVVFSLLVAGLVYGSCIYAAARLGYCQRLRRPVSWLVDDSCTSVGEGPCGGEELLILIPSYREEVEVIRRTVLSGALQTWPRKRLMLLIDDPPHPGGDVDRALLQAARGIPGEIRERLRIPRQHCQQALQDPPSLERLARLHRDLAVWFGQQVDTYPQQNHEDAFFVRAVLRERQGHHQRRAAWLDPSQPQDSGAAAEDAMAPIPLAGGERPGDPGEPSLERIRREIAWLGQRFTLSISSFERKRFANLSHAPSKAMNLNAALDLLGRRFRVATTADAGEQLLEVQDGEADLHVPVAPFIATLDADTVVHPAYGAHLISLMQQPDNADVAVAQTPYSAFPGAPGLLERTAGATTDIQYIIHQGFEAFDASFWVGANALLRHRALLEIAVTTSEGGRLVRRFISDRTVIEDTESSVDLVRRGWRIHNHPQRLAYSSTPADYGSLVIQRRRWANGGLLILPNLLRTGRHWRGGPATRLLGPLMRLHYLLSITLVNLGLLLLFLFPFPELNSVWLPLTALPYYLLCGRDLVQNGYRVRDLLRVYALNLLLIPVNISGVLASLRQGLTGRRSPFQRTPKITTRTQAARLDLLWPRLIMASLALGIAVSLSRGAWVNACFSGLNLLLLLWGFLLFTRPVPPAAPGQGDGAPPPAARPVGADGSPRPQRSEAAFRP